MMSREELEEFLFPGDMEVLKHNFVKISDFMT